MCYSNVIQIEKNPKWKIIHGVEEIPYPAKSQPNPVNIAIDIANDEDNTSTIDNSNASETIEVLELGQKTTVIARNCQRYDLFLNYTGFKVEWDGKEGNPINQILVTDVELSSFECDISSFSYCHHSAKLCLCKIYRYL